MAGILDDRAHDRRHGTFEVCVREDDVRRLAAELDRHRDDIVRRRPGDEPTHLRRAGEAEVVDSRMRRERSTRFLAQAGHDVEGAGRQAGLDRKLGDAHARDRRFFRGLQDAAVAGRERGRDRPPDHLRRVVPGDDVPGHAVRLAERVDEDLLPERDRVAVDGLDRARVEVEVACCDGHVGSGLRERLARIAAFEALQLLLMAPDRLGDALEDVRAVGGGAPAPGAQRLPGGAHRLVDLGRPAPGRLREDLARSRVEIVERGPRAHGLAGDQRVAAEQLGRARHRVCAPIACWASRNTSSNESATSAPASASARILSLGRPRPRSTTAAA